ncbi:MAG: hypothetical protein ACP5HK_03450 [Acidilobus sp.]
MTYEELGALIDILLKYVEGLDRSEKRILNVNTPAAIASVTLYKAWKASLLRLASKARDVYEEANRGNKVAASVDACELFDMVNRVIIGSSPEDPVYLELRATLSYLRSTAMAICGIPQATIQP